MLKKNHIRSRYNAYSNEKRYMIKDLKVATLNVRDITHKVGKPNWELKNRKTDTAIISERKEEE
jgi:hypothetical protein